MSCRGGTLTNGTDKFYPNAYYEVGDLFLTTRNENPNLRFGGVWELYGKGKMLVCVDPDDSDFSTVKKTGGEKTHKLTISEIPDHYHTVPAGNNPTTASNYDHVASSYGGGTPKGLLSGKTGGGNAHNNMSPYITCYTWIRVE